MIILATAALRYTGIGMFLFGCLVVWAALRMRWMRPPGWVRDYDGHGSIGLGLLFGGIWLMSFIALALDGLLPSFVQLPLIWVGMVAVSLFRKRLCRERAP